MSLLHFADGSHWPPALWPRVHPLACIHILVQPRQPAHDEQCPRSGRRFPRLLVWPSSRPCLPVESLSVSQNPWIPDPNLQRTHKGPWWSSLWRTVSPRTSVMVRVKFMDLKTVTSSQKLTTRMKQAQTQTMCQVSGGGYSLKKCLNVLKSTYF